MHRCRPRIPLSKFTSGLLGGVKDGEEGQEPARREVPLVRIFLSSPGDVAEERALARQLIDSRAAEASRLS